MDSRKLLEEYKKKGFANVRRMKVYDNDGTEVVTIQADARKNIPSGEMSMGSSRRNPRVHIASYVPSSNRTFRFSTKYALKGSAKVKPKKRSAKKISKPKKPAIYGLQMNRFI